MKWKDKATDPTWQPWFAWFPVREQIDYGPLYRWLWLEWVYRQYNEARAVTKAPWAIGDQYVYTSKDDPMNRLPKQK